MAIGVAAGSGLICGLLNGFLVVFLRIHPFIVTMGTLSIFRGLALISVPVKSLPAQGRELPHALTAFMGYRLTLPFDWTLFGYTLVEKGTFINPVPMLIMLSCVLCAWVYLEHRVGGRELFAVGGNEEAARFSGLPVERIKLRVYALSGLMGGIAGFVSAGHYGSANTATGLGYELNVIAAAVVGGASMTGGRGSAFGAMLGALVIKLIENGIEDGIDFFHMDALSSAIALKVNCDLQLTLMASSLYRLLGSRIGEGYERAKSRQLFDKFVDATATVTIAQRDISVRFQKRAHNPLLMAAGFDREAISVPWLGRKRLK